MSRYDSFTHHRLAPALDPVNSSWFFISAEVPTNRQDLQFREFFFKPSQSLLRSLRTHMVVIITRHNINKNIFEALQFIRLYYL